MKFSVTPRYRARRSPVMGQNIVATSEPRAAQAGLEMLRRGGNAVDAALAAAITLVVTEPVSNGLGSDAFAIVWDGEALHGLNASGRSPAAWTPERFGPAGVPFRGWDSVTVPGAVSAWVVLSERFGRLPFADLFEAAIRYARDGYLVTPVVAKAWEVGAAELAGEPGFAEHFLPGGAAPRPGTLFSCPPMARSLEAIAATKGEAFYRGALAEAKVAHAARHGGSLTLDDLAAHSADFVGTISAPFGDKRVHEIPPNGQGIAALKALRIIDRVDLGDDPDSDHALHMQIEAMKLALADLHAHVADPAAMRLDVAELLDGDYVAARAALIDPDRAQAFDTGKPMEGGTVYLATGDADGMMVSFNQSNYAGFGSGVVVPGTGISLQNRGAGFVSDPRHANAIGPRKRPFHTIIPGFLMDDAGAPVAAFGVMGGPIQAQGHLQTVVRMERFGEDPQTTCEAPRFRVLGGLDVAVERELRESTLDGLARRGHRLSFDAPGVAFGFGGAQIVRRVEGGYVAGSDPRKDGQAVAF